jgi:hypothetical protein
VWLNEAFGPGNWPVSEMPAGTIQIVPAADAVTDLALLVLLALETIFADRCAPKLESVGTGP